MVTDTLDTSNLPSEAFVIAEYEMLRSEVIARIEKSQNVVSLSLVAWGAFVGAALQEEINPSVLLVYPLIAFFLAAGWAHNEVRMRQIGDYVRMVEVRFNYSGWGHALTSLGASGRILRLYGPLAASGVFLATQGLTIALLPPLADLEGAEWILLWVDIILIVLTVPLVGAPKIWRAPRV